MGRHWAADDYVSGILSGDRVVLGRAITLVESTRAEHRELANSILEKCLPHSGNSFRIGVTGPPGVGKSSFIEAFGEKLVREQARNVAVLAIDPSSSVSGGSILGDKTRMEKLGNLANAFIRPSPAGKTLGGVANCTHETILLCEAAGFDTIIIETVGVGQSETAVSGMVDFFLLLHLPGAGDELQGIKRGIVELADLVAVNKADGERLELAKSARRDLAQALHFYPEKPSGWLPKAVTCSSLTLDGLSDVWSLMLDYQQITKANGWFNENRKRQRMSWFSSQLSQALERFFYENDQVKAALQPIRLSVENGELSPTQAVGHLMDLFQTAIAESKK
ncbi:MAG: methylmalonyl Co-A mutase-associated GTPase MeaB [Saprospiraceae bacterium]|nr:methylmalonyl Co-A mutase-associated GTPase MeaB [Saprospiraceae bacterium]